MSLLETVSGVYQSQEIVLRDGKREIRTDALADRAHKFKASLPARLTGPVGLLADNGCDWVIADLACQDCDRCLLPLPTFFSDSQIEHALNSSAANLLLTDRPLPDSDFEYCEPVAGTELLMYQRQQPGKSSLLPEGTGKITFTSGSTGMPRGVCLSHAQQIQQARALADAVDIDKPNHLCLLPLSTLLENIAGVYAPLLSHGQVIVPSLQELGFNGSSLQDSKRLLQSISQYQPDSLILVPQLLQLLVGAATSGWKTPESLKFIAVGGSRVANGLLKQASELGLPVFEGYGLSECCSVVSLNTPRDQQQGSTGRPLPHLDVTLDEGEVIIRGNNMLGYVGDASTWFPDSIRSGDLGSIDNNGFLTIQGRRKNLLINSMGRNISPEWIEAEILAHPGLAEAVVFGDAQPYCVALITRRDPDLSEVAVAEWLDAVNSKLPDYARIQNWRLLVTQLHEHPGLLTDNGRPRRDAISKQFAAHIDELYHQASVA